MTTTFHLPESPIPIDDLLKTCIVKQEMEDTPGMTLMEAIDFAEERLDEMSDWDFIESLSILADGTAR